MVDIKRNPLVEHIARLMHEEYTREVLRGGDPRNVRKDGRVKQVMEWEDFGERTREIYRAVAHAVIEELRRRKNT